MLKSSVDGPNTTSVSGMMLSLGLLERIDSGLGINSKVPVGIRRLGSGNTTVDWK